MAYFGQRKSISPGGVPGLQIRWRSALRAFGFDSYLFRQTALHLSDLEQQ